MLTYYEGEGEGKIEYCKCLLVSNVVKWEKKLWITFLILNEALAIIKHSFLKNIIDSIKNKSFF